MFRDNKILSRMGGGGGGGAQISANPCESAASTLDGHNFLFRTPIRAFLEHWAGSWTVEE